MAVSNAGTNDKHTKLLAKRTILRTKKTSRSSKQTFIIYLRLVGVIQQFVGILEEGGFQRYVQSPRGKSLTVSPH